MKRIGIIFIFLALAISLKAQDAITYEFSGGRFGDNVLTYLHAKWLSYQTGIPLLYRPFNYSDKLVLHDKEKLFINSYKIINNEMNSPFFKHIVLSMDFPIPRRNNNALYICPYFPEAERELKLHPYFYFPAGWKDPRFRKIVRELIAPKEQCALILPPSNMVSIALHLRDGGNFDDFEFRYKDPLKMPPLSFYIQCLQMIIGLCHEKPIHCQIFSDSTRLDQLVTEIKASLPIDAPIVFDYRKENNSDEVQVLEDFFSLFQYDILIRATSNFSIVPSLIHDYALVFSPCDFTISGTNVSIDQIKLEKNDKLFKLCLKK